MVVKRLLDGRFQFIRVVSTKNYCKTYLMADRSDPNHAKCIVKHLQLPARNPVTLKFLVGLIKKKTQLLEELGQCPAIAPTLAAFQEGKDFYYVRPYIVGQSLQSEISGHEPRTEAEVRRLLEELLRALQSVQALGVVHQNIQPSNIIRREQDGRLVLVDFGLVQEAGSPMPPKLANGLAPEVDEVPVYLPHVHHRRYPHFNTDHFALGLIALQFATGLSAEALPRPHQKDFLAQVKLQLDECSALSEDLKATLLGMIMPQPEQPFQSAKDILARLSLSDSPEGEADSPTPREAPHRLLMPSRKQLWIGLGTLLALLALGIWGLRVPQRMQASWLSRQATQAKQSGQVDAAMDYLTQVIELSPNSGATLAQRSELHWEQGEAELALQDLTDAIQADPKSPNWYFQRGNLRFYLGDLQGAIADYTDALELDKTYVDAFINRGSARAERGDEQGAIEDYTAALTLEPGGDKQASAYLNRCLSQSNLGNHTQGLADCTAAINLRPNNSLAYENRGLVKRRLDDFQGSLQDFTIAIQISPGSAEPYYNRGLTRQDLGDLSGALEDFNQTVKLDPEHPFVHYDRGLIYAQRGDYEKAIADFEVTASTCLELGRLGCFEDAQYQIKQLQALDSENPSE